MRFFKSNQPMSQEDEAAAVRLTAVSNRTKAAQTTVPTWGNAVEPTKGNYEPLELKEVLQ